MNPPEIGERPVGLVRGTRDWLPESALRLATLESGLLRHFARSGYAPMRTPILEFTELHERKSGAGIVSKLFELGDAHQARLCLRPELTASIVRAYAEAAEPPPLPWRVSMSGPVFRFEKEPQEGHYREFTQVGVELLGAPGPAGDAEVIALATSGLREVGLADVTVRIGHVGLILEMLERSGLPPSARSALVETLSLASAEGRVGSPAEAGGIAALESALRRFEGWLESAEAEPVEPLAAADAGEGEVDRLFRQLVPDVTGRRSGHEILGRLRRKWDLAHTLHGVLGRVRGQVHELADLRGPAADVLGRVGPEIEAAAPESVAGLRDLVRLLGLHGLPPDRVELDLGFGRGIGFYSQMVFELLAETPSGPVEVGGGGRYDGLARVLGSGRDDRGVGFALGLERLQHVLEARDGSPPVGAGQGTLILAAPGHFDEALAFASELRRHRRKLGDDAPIVGPQPLEGAGPIEGALAPAPRLGLDEVALVGKGDSATGRVSWYRWDGARWSKSNTPPILLAGGGAEGLR
jgi:histidyl-tRNA synthetase